MEAETGDLEIYKRVQAHIRHLESRSFAALGNFLTANAFMLAAWATLFNHPVVCAEVKVDIGGLDAVLLLMSFVGFWAGCGWGLLGARNWEYVHRYVAELIRVGARIKPQPGENGKSFFRTFRDVERVVKDDWAVPRFFFSRQPFLASKIPLAVALIHLAMFVFLAWDRVFPVWGGPDPNRWFAIGVGIVGLMWLTHLCCWCSGRGGITEALVKKASEDIGETDLDRSI